MFHLIRKGFVNSTARPLPFLRIKPLLIGALVSVLGFPAMPARAQTVSREDLEPGFKAHLAAEAAGDTQAWLAGLADSTVAEMRNEALSSKRPFPTPLRKPTRKQHPSKAAFENLTFVALRQNGPRAILVYSNPVLRASADGQASEFLLADFVRQDGGWKLLRQTHKQDEKAAARFKAGDLKVWNQPEFNPPAEIPPVPPPVTAPDYVAYFDYFVLAQKVTLTVNGIPHLCEGDSGTRLVLGGLRKGENKIRVEYKSTPGRLAVGDNKIRINVVTKNVRLTQAFLFKWRDDAGRHESTLTIDDDFLRTLPKAEVFY